MSKFLAKLTLATAIAYFLVGNRRKYSGSHKREVQF